MNNESSQPLPPNGRLISAGMAAAAAIGMLINHYTIGSQNVGRLMILCLGPIAFFIGLGGIVESRRAFETQKSLNIELGLKYPSDVSLSRSLIESCPEIRRLLVARLSATRIGIQLDA